MLCLVSGCAHRAHVTGLQSNPGARVDTATFSRFGDDVVVDVALSVEGTRNDENPQILVRAQIPCRVGPVPPPPGFTLVYVTSNPTMLSTMTVGEGYITVHKCEGNIVVMSGGWDVEGDLNTPLEKPFSAANPPIPVRHVELTAITVTEVKSADGPRSP